METTGEVDDDSISWTVTNHDFVKVFIIVGARVSCLLLI